MIIIEQFITSIGDYIYQFADGTQSNPELGLIVLFVGLGSMAIIATISSKG